ncbi:MAG: hypothetical protein ACRDZY_09470 [Acidimicrobiales bacterium]
MNATPLRPTSSRRAALYANPALRGDLLAVAQCWDYLISAGLWPTLTTVAVMTGIGWDDAASRRRIRHLFLEDLPRYQEPDQPKLCGCPGPRGGRCPHGWRMSRPLHDPDDGTTTWLVWCYQHRGWAVRQVDAHLDRLGGRAAPLPAYTNRSVIAGHFPEVDWTTWWATLTTSYPIRRQYNPARDPTRGGGHLATPPTLRIVP